MIITRTPLRISLVGGGTDMPAFYNVFGGAVISMTIDKYVYVSLNKKFDGRIRLSYSKTENVKTPEQLKHDLARACIELFDERGLEITSISDIPGAGSGLGSSSAFTVGLLSALSSYNGAHWSPKSLAESAYLVESQFCGHETGKQDQYAAAYGGLKFYEFCKDGRVRVEPFDLLDEEKCFIAARMMLFWTGRSRKAIPILKEQNHNLGTNNDHMRLGENLRSIAFELYADIKKHELYNIGKQLHMNWLLKKKLAHGISDPSLDELYDKAIMAGATGGKVCGAGGGGFMLIYAEPDKQGAIEKAIGLRRVSFKMDDRGSTIIYPGE